MLNVYNLVDKFWHKYCSPSSAIDREVARKSVTVNGKPSVRLNNFFFSRLEDNGSRIWHSGSVSAVEFSVTERSVDLAIWHYQTLFFGAIWRIISNNKSYNNKAFKWLVVHGPLRSPSITTHSLVFSPRPQRLKVTCSCGCPWRYLHHFRIKTLLD